MSSNADFIPFFTSSAAKYAKLGFLKIAENACRQYGDKVWIGDKDDAVLLLAGARHIRFFIGHESSFPKGFDHLSSASTVGRILLGQALTTSREGEEWRLARRLTTPLVNPKSELLQKGTQLSARWLMATLRDPEQRSLREICLRWALMGVAEGFFGSALSLAQLDKLLGHFRNIYLQLIAAAPVADYAALCRHPALLAFRQEVKSMIGPLIDGAKREGTTMVERLCQALDVNANPEEQERVINLLLGNLAASVDNTGIALLWCLTHLSQHPQYQKRVRDEGQQEKRNMASAIVRESLRLTPVAAFFERQTQEDLVLDGARIAAGTRVLFSPWLVHRNAAYWPEPLSFKPERFLGKDKIPPEYFFPFSVGKRNCVGMALAMDQLTTAISTLCQHFHFSLAPSTLPAALTPLFELNAMPRGEVCFILESLNTDRQNAPIV
ncbi:cytochrome P450 [Sodalis ligni]|uniref:cytochrome P450 n=1 Tax=Sodalis ligni TaxID=2697027 RepID=UPI00193EF58C|nr:cytochrome P450 [Sodalis ligni]QWA13216.1 cytochrome P450 [Sodalis ligni]